MAREGFADRLVGSFGVAPPGRGWQPRLPDRGARVPFEFRRSCLNSAGARGSPAGSRPCHTGRQWGTVGAGCVEGSCPMG